jgi:membrane protein DedA with SNARE-associated domain
MIELILATLAHWVIVTINATGYIGVFVLMAAESANIPIPSEVIMPFSGFLASQGNFLFWMVVLVGALGNLAGSLVSYYFADWIVSHKDKPVLNFLISDSLLVTSKRWFDRYGGMTTFFSRLLPVVRTFISLPAGLGKMNVVRFSAYTFLGSFIWSAFLAWIGWILGEHWHDVSQYFRKFEYVFAGVIVVLGAWWLYKHVRGMMIKKDVASTTPED